MKIVLLTKGKFAKIDDEDFDRVSNHKWQVRADRGKKNFYAQRPLYLGKIDGKYRQSTLQMSRFILGVTDPNIKIDHKNGDTLDNRKENLRIATTRENNSNLHNIKSNNTSGYRGVIKRTDGKTVKWRARINLMCGKKKSLGQFNTPEESAKAFDKAAKEIYGEFCGKLSFE